MTEKPPLRRTIPLKCNKCGELGHGRPDCIGRAMRPTPVALPKPIPEDAKWNGYAPRPAANPLFRPASERFW